MKIRIISLANQQIDWPNWPTVLCCGVLALSCCTSRAEERAGVAPPPEQRQLPLTAETARSGLHDALGKLQQPDKAAVESTLLSVIAAPAFGALDASDQHAALAAASGLALGLAQPERAHELAIRATAMSDQSISDWMVRVRAALALDDTADALLCLTQLAGRWHSFDRLPDEVILRTAASAARLNLDAPLLQMLKAVYAMRWHQAEDAELDAMWLDLTRLLLAQGATDDAADVAAHIVAPYAVIAMRADNRYREVRKSRFVNTDVRKAMAADIDTRTSLVRSAPRSLIRAVTLAAVLLHARRENDALALTTTVLDRVRSAAPAVTAYDDAERELPWILDVRSDALNQLGRYDEAVAQLQQAVALALPTGHHVGERINLAHLLCTLDRPAEALALLPGDKEVSAFGRMQIEIVRVMAATQQVDAQAAEQALSYLRLHQRDAPATLQSALLWAGKSDEAAQFLVARLQDGGLRIDALKELQEYSEPPAPPRMQEWRTRYRALRERPEVRAAVRQVGTIERYSLAPPND